MKAVRSAVIALSLCSLSAAAQNAEKFVSKTTGFSLTKPAGWHYVAGVPLTADFSAEELRAAYEMPTTVTLVGMRRDEAFGELEVTLIPRGQNAGKVSAKQVLERMIAGLKKQFPDFNCEVVREATLSGHAAAEYAATYTVKAPTRTIPLRVRAILVPRGKFFYQIDMTAPVAEYEQVSKEFASIVSSITIEP